MTTRTPTLFPLAAPSQRTRMGFALAAVYLIWSSTYLAMRWAVDALPPLSMASIRFLVAGSILMIVARLRGTPWPRPREWLGAALLGVLFFVGGNGLVAVAERNLGSGLAAVVCATMPLWLALWGALGGGPPPRRREWLGLVSGFSGVLVLLADADVAGAPEAVAVLALAPISWSLGARLAPRLTQPRGLASPAAQMLAGGVALGLAGLAAGERIEGGLPTRAWASLAYLIVFGSLIAFSAFTWLVHHARPAVATSYAFVNPVLALALGAFAGGETLAPPLMAGAALVAGAVALLITPTRSSRVPKARSTPTVSKPA